MGTRADFYTEKDKKLNWLGSIGMDGMPNNMESNIISSTSGYSFKKNVKSFLNNRGDATFPKDGWPWPWNDSNMTDYSYVYLSKPKKVGITNFGVWQEIEGGIVEKEITGILFPNMSEIMVFESR